MFFTIQIVKVEKFSLRISGIDKFFGDKISLRLKPNENANGQEERIYICLKVLTDR